MDRLLSVVVSVYNEEKALEDFYKETTGILKDIDWAYELIFVNDGSSDQSLAILERLSASDRAVKVVSFSRNFGHEAAMIAGLDYSSGDGIICMDADLQHPPECIPVILERLSQGYEVINMVRTRNQTAGFIKNITSSGFYWLINHISDVHFESNASDFFAISRHVAQVLKDSYREKVRFLRGYVQNVGFKKTTIEYEARARVAGGEQVQHQEAVRVLHQYNPVFFQYAAEAGNLCRRFFRPPGFFGHDLHPPDPQGRSQRLCNHRGTALLHVRNDVHSYWDHW